jgi:PleD family two-component response regulator
MVASQLAQVGGDGTAFRYGGEEFAIVVPSGTSEALDHAEAVRQAIETKPFVVRGPDHGNPSRKERRHRTAKRSVRAASQTTSVTVSIGIAGPSAKLVTPEEVIKAADKALYRAKESGRNRVEMYSAGLKAKASAAAGRD